MEEVYCHIGNFTVCKCDTCECGAEEEFENSSTYCSSPGSDDCECYPDIETLEE